MNRPRVLIACEFSGIVRDAMNATGCDAVSCDLLPTERPGPHIQEDVLSHLGDGWDMMIFFADCTFLANSGVRWLYKDGSSDVGRWKKMIGAAAFFNKLLNAPIVKIAGENPIQHLYARRLIRKYDQIVQPWQFGHGETKATCLWFKNLPPLKPTDIVDGRIARVHREQPGPERWKNRSRTYEGIARAMAEQWGRPLVEKMNRGEHQ